MEKTHSSKSLTCPACGNERGISRKYREYAGGNPPAYLACKCCECEYIWTQEPLFALKKANRGVPGATSHTNEYNPGPIPGCFCAMCHEQREKGIPPQEVSSTHANATE